MQLYSRNALPPAGYVELLYRSFRGFSEGNNVDIVGVTSSILVTPTIQSLDIKGLSGNRRPFCVVLHRFGEPTIDGDRHVR